VNTAEQPSQTTPTYSQPKQINLENSSQYLPSDIWPEGISRQSDILCDFLEFPRDINFALNFIVSYHFFQKLLKMATGKKPKLKVKVAPACLVLKDTCHLVQNLPEEEETKLKEALLLLLTSTFVPRSLIKETVTRDFLLDSNKFVDFNSSSLEVELL
jgi:hypothetical protein